MLAQDSCIDARHPAVDRCAYLSEVQVEARRRERRFRRVESGLGLVLFRGHPLELDGGDRPGVRQALASRSIGSRQREIALRAPLLGLQPGYLLLERPRIDLEQQSAFLDARAFREMHRGHRAVDPGV